MIQGENDHKKPLQIIDNLTETIHNHIDKGTKKADSSFSLARIYRVPEELRKGNESAYTPQLVAIGPLHCNDKHLKPMQDVKKSYTNRLICRVKGQEKRFMVLKECVEELKNCLDEAKKFYAEVVVRVADHQEKGKEVMPPVDKANKQDVGEELSLSDNDILEMMLVDGCFILELLYRYVKPEDHMHKDGLGGGKHDEAFTSSDLSSPLLPASNKANMEKETLSVFQNPGSAPGWKNSEWNRANIVVNVTERPMGGDGGHHKPLDPIFDRCLPLTTVKQDLALLENQIPFFVLEKLFTHTLKKIPNHPDDKYSLLTNYISLFFGDIMNPESNSTNTGDSVVLSMTGKNLTNSGEDTEKHYDHILHKLHEDHRPVAHKNEGNFPMAPQKDSKKDRQRKVLIPRIPCASELEYAGVKFVKGGGNNLFEANFIKPEGPFWWCHRARFEIPPLGVYDQTELFFRNLIAYEQCCPKVSQHFTSYAYLMDMLVDSDKDIKVLEKAGILKNYLGDHKDAANLFNKLCNETTVYVGAEFIFADLCYEAKAYSARCWPKNLAHIQRTYFASPWTFIAFVVGFVTFGIAIVSFIFSFL